MAKIFCYSATGNSLYAAKKIGEAIGAELHNTTFRGEVSDEIIGIVFPTFFWGLPNGVTRFLRQVRFTHNNPYIFAVSTYGGICGGIGGIVDNELNKQGKNLSYFNKVKAVENYIVSLEVNNTEKVWEQTDEKLSEIITDIKSFKRNTAVTSFVNKMAQSVYPPNKKDCTLSFVIDGCISCGLCAKVCPNHNIRGKNGRPIFGSRCDLCLACIHACPAQAINYGKSTLGKKRYKNPKISLKELAAFNSKKEK